MRLPHLSALRSSNVCLNCDHVVNWLDLYQIHTDYNTGYRHVVTSNLQPSSRSSTQIDQHSGLLEKVVLSIQLDQLEGRSRSVASLFCQVIEFITSPLS